MRTLASALVVSFYLSHASAVQMQASPIQKVVQLLTELERKIIADGQAEKKAFAEYMDWCENGAKDKEFEIKTAKADIEDLKATIGKAQSDLATSASKIEEVSASITSNSADLKAATGIREKEESEFIASEKELVDTIDTLERAINVLERKLHGSAMLQAKLDNKNVQNLIRTLSVVIDAASLSLHDRTKLLGLVQSSEEADEDALDPDTGAPAAAAYKSHSGSIIDVLEDLKQKAMTQLDEARKEEINAKHNFELLKQSLEDQIAVDTKEVSDAKGMKHEATESKATAEGDLAVTTKDLTEAEDVLKNMKGDCQTKASDNEMSTKNREDELKAIASAKKALLENTGGAAEVTYGDFLQLRSVHGQAGTLKTRADLIHFEVVNLVRNLAREQQSPQLTQLATRIAAAMQQGSSTGSDPFAKVKDLITDMIARLQKEAGEEAAHKAYCDKEMGETKQKIDELKYDIEKYSSKIDKSKAQSVTLKDEVATLSRELAKIAKSQADAIAVRKEENTAYLKVKTDLEQGLSGVRMALKILRDYYSGDGAFVQQPEDPGVHKSSEAGGTIIGMLEVVESDMGKALASANMNEEVAATAYQRLSMDNKMQKMMKDKDVKYKTKEAAELDKTITEVASDRESASTELDAVLQYTKNIRGMCELKPESYDSRKERRTQEIEGLKEALKILEGEAVFLQRQRRVFRGATVKIHS